MARRLLAILAALCLMAAMGSVGASALATNNYANGEFHILVIPDAHQTADEDSNLIGYIESAIMYMAEQKSPLDLVLFLGDSVSSSGCADKAAIEKAVGRLLAPVIAAQIPYTLVFGNHDYGDIPDTAKATLSRAELLDIWRAASQTEVEVEVEVDIGGGETETQLVTQTVGLFAEPEAPEHQYASATGGVTNFYYPIYKNNVLYAQLFLFDVGSKNAGEGGYDYVRADQLAWFEGLNVASVPAYVFQHIPVPEIYSGGFFLKSPFNWALPGTKNILGTNYFGMANYVNMVGTVLEAPSPPLYTDGWFETVTDKGNVQAAFFGHDHVNNFIEKFPSKKLDLVQLPGAAWNGSYGTFVVRGGSFVSIRNSTGGGATYNHDFFTYRQATRVKETKVGPTINGFNDFILSVPFVLQNVLINVLAPIRWIGGGF